MNIVKKSFLLICFLSFSLKAMEPEAPVINAEQTIGKINGGIYLLEVSISDADIVSVEFIEQGANLIIDGITHLMPQIKAFQDSASSTKGCFMGVGRILWEMNELAEKIKNAPNPDKEGIKRLISTKKFLFDYLGSLKPLRDKTRLVNLGTELRDAAITVATNQESMDELIPHDPFQIKNLLGSTVRTCTSIWQERKGKKTAKMIKDGKVASEEHEEASPLQTEWTLEKTTRIYTQTTEKARKLHTSTQAYLMPRSGDSEYTPIDEEKQKEALAEITEGIRQSLLPSTTKRALTRVAQLTPARLSRFLLPSKTEAAVHGTGEGEFTLAEVPGLTQKAIATVSHFLGGKTLEERESWRQQTKEKLYNTISPHLQPEGVKRLTEKAKKGISLLDKGRHYAEKLADHATKTRTDEEAGFYFLKQLAQINRQSLQQLEEGLSLQEEISDEDIHGRGVLSESDDDDGLSSDDDSNDQDLD